MVGVGETLDDVVGVVCVSSAPAAAACSLTPERAEVTTGRRQLGRLAEALEAVLQHVHVDDDPRVKRFRQMQHQIAGIKERAAGVRPRA